MSLIILGVNHKTASIDIREKLSFLPEQIPDALEDFKTKNLASEIVIYSTCNRTELYLVNTTDINDIYEWLADYHKIDAEIIKKNSYLFTDHNASKHLFRVATGLDSIALGEPQILGQVKEAYKIASNANTVDQTINKLFQESFYVAKNIRNDTKLGENSISIAYSAIKLSEQFFSEYNELTAMIIGAGQTGELAAKIISKKGIGQLIIANRTVSKAENLISDLDKDMAFELSGHAISTEQIEEHLHKADIIISATNKSEFTVTQSMVKNTCKLRKNKMQLFLDLAVPRDIDPTIKKLNNSYLYAVDDLQNIVKKNKSLRIKAAEQAEQMIDVYNKNFTDWLKLRKHHTLIRDLYEYAQDEKQKLTDNALKQIKSGDNVEDVINSLASKLTKKLTHHPSLLIRQASEKGNIDTIEEIKSVYKFK